ncbi:hypothetical protein J3A83DRAFT_4092772, partial [Scleroderma citrinum]
RMTTLEKAIRVPVEIQGPMNDYITVSTLLDSSATGSFIDASWAHQNHIKVLPLQNPIPVLNVDGTRTREGDITHGVTLFVKISCHAEKLWFAATRSL